MIIANTKKNTVMKESAVTLNKLLQISFVELLNTIN